MSIPAYASPVPCSLRGRRSVQPGIATLPLQGHSGGAFVAELGARQGRQRRAPPSKDLVPPRSHQNFHHGLGGRGSLPTSRCRWKAAAFSLKYPSSLSAATTSYVTVGPNIRLRSLAWNRVHVASTMRATSSNRDRPFGDRHPSRFNDSAVRCPSSETSAVSSVGGIAIRYACTPLSSEASAFPTRRYTSASRRRCAGRRCWARAAGSLLSLRTRGSHSTLLSSMSCAVPSFLEQRPNGDCGIRFPVSGCAAAAALSSPVRRSDQW